MLSKMKIYKYAIKGIQHTVDKIEKDFKEKTPRLGNLTKDELKEIKDNARELSYLQEDIESLRELVYNEYKKNRPRKS